MEDGRSRMAPRPETSPRSSIFDPQSSTVLLQTQSLERPVLLHLFKKAPVDQLLRRNFCRAWIGPADLVERRLDRAGFDVELRFQNFQLSAIGRIEKSSISEIDLLGHHLVGQL